MDQYSRAMSLGETNKNTQGCWTCFCKPEAAFPLQQPPITLSGKNPNNRKLFIPPPPTHHCTCTVVQQPHSSCKQKNSGGHHICRSGQPQCATRNSAFLSPGFSIPALSSSSQQRPLCKLQLQRRPSLRAQRLGELQAGAEATSSFTLMSLPSQWHKEEQPLHSARVTKGHQLGSSSTRHKGSGLWCKALSKTSSIFNS